MGNRTISLLLGFIFLFAALGWFLFGPDGTERTPRIDEFKKVEIDGISSIKVPPYLREGEKTREYVNLHLENRIKEIFLQVEVVDLERYGYSKDELAAESFNLGSELYWKSQIDTVSIDDEGVEKQFTPLRKLDSLDVPAYFFTMQVEHPVNKRMDIYTKQVLYQVDGTMYILTLITNAAFEEKYKKLFDLIIYSFETEMESTAL